MTAKRLFGALDAGIRDKNVVNALVFTAMFALLGCTTDAEQTRNVNAGSGDAMCRAPSAVYGPTSTFQVTPNAPVPDVRCPSACGASAWSGSTAGPNIDVALPYGTCELNTPACAAAAVVPCACPGSQGPFHGFVCSCSGGMWDCRISSQGSGICLPCDAGGQ